MSDEIESVAVVIDLALGGRLGTIRQCQIPGCGEWDVTKNNERIYRCKKCSLHGVRKEAAERKKQVSAAQKKVRESEKKEDEAYRERLRKAGRKPSPSLVVRHRVRP